MRSRCKPGEVLLPPKVAEHLLAFHGGQNSALYAVGSSTVARRCVPAKLLRDAAYELGDFTTGVVDPRWAARAWRLRKFLLAMAGDR